METIKIFQHTGSSLKLLLKTGREGYFKIMVTDKWMYPGRALKLSRLIGVRRTIRPFRILDEIPPEGVRGGDGIKQECFNELLVFFFFRFPQIIVFIFIGNIILNN